MKLLQNPALLEKYLAQYEIPQKFDTPGLPFCLWEYERGEILNYIKDPGQVLRFLVSGTIQIYAVRADGSRYPLSHSDGFTLLGDMEFCGENSLPFLVGTFLLPDFDRPQGKEPVPTADRPDDPSN